MAYEGSATKASQLLPAPKVNSWRNLKSQSMSCQILRAKLFHYPSFALDLHHFSTIHQNPEPAPHAPESHKHPKKMSRSESDVDTQHFSSESEVSPDKPEPIQTEFTPSPFGSEASPRNPGIRLRRCDAQTAATERTAPKIRRTKSSPGPPPSPQFLRNPKPPQ